jgi:hypothetical protein
VASVGAIHGIEIQAVIVDSDAIQRIKVHGVTSKIEAGATGMLLEVHIWPTTDAAPSGSLVAAGYEVLGVGASTARRILDESRRDCWRKSCPKV